MSDINHFNPEYYNAGLANEIPRIIGDRYYGQDKVRDFRFLQDRIGMSIEDLSKIIPCIISGGFVTQGTGDTLDITACIGYISFAVDVMNSFAATPPTVISKDLNAIRVASTAQTNLAIGSATLDGATINYVKLAYAETDGATRSRAKKTGTYSYEKDPSFLITVSSVAPTSYEIALCTFIGSAGGTFLFDYSTEDRRINEDHFKTNYSIEQKEDTEDTQFDLQQMFQSMPFEKEFTAVNNLKTFIENVDTILVPADSHEVTPTGTWSNDDGASHKFGRALRTNTEGDTLDFDFSGVACGVAFEVDTDQSYFTAELSDDGGVTWKFKKKITTDGSLNQINVVTELYSGLKYDDYRVRLTSGETFAGVSYIMRIEYFYYTSYMCQRPITQWADLAGNATGIDDLPPTTALLSGTWGLKVNNDAVGWNSSYMRANVANDYVEFKFYGSKVWVSLLWSTDTDCTVTPLIDGSSAKVKSTSFNVDVPANSNPTFIRLDDGTLEEKEHTVRITMSAPAGADFMYVCGFGYYSKSAVSTISRSLMVGKDSYIEGCDSSNFTYNGGGWAGPVDSTDSLLRRSNTTSTQTDDVEITTPNNSELQAIYGVFSLKSATGAEIKTQLAGGSDRWIDLDTANLVQGNMIMLLYDKNLDGDLHNKVLHIEHDDGVAGALEFEGVIFEIGDIAEIDTMWAMPKWTRFNNSMNTNCPSTTAHRIDVFGRSNDKRSGRRPMVHSGWTFSSISTASFYRHGLGLMPEDFSIQLLRSSNGDNREAASAWRQTDIELFGGAMNHPGFLDQVGAFASAIWWKFIIHPDRVI